MKRLLTAAFLTFMSLVAGDALTQQILQQRLAGAATALTQHLGSALHRRSQVPFNSENRFDWHYTPRSRRGVPLEALSDERKIALDNLLHTALSDQGFAKAKGIIELEPILGRIEGSPRFRDPGQYYVTLFGDPAQTPWGMRFEGHHLSLNFTVTSSEVRATPAFYGANPARVPSGPRADWRVLRDEELLGRELVTSLSPEQRKRAIISSRAPFDIVTGVDRQIDLASYDGLAAGAMTPPQRALFLRLVRSYVGNATESIASGEMEKLTRAGIERLHFAWAGSLKAGEPHYYRIHGPTILIEYDNTQNSANHIHTVWRTPGRDFGEDLLQRHYAEAPHHRHAR
jgi:uncharacterized protein DUF3500